MSRSLQGVFKAEIADLARGFWTPRSIERVQECLAKWARFLKEKGVRRRTDTQRGGENIHHYIEFQRWLLDQGLSIKTVNDVMSGVRSYYALKGNRQPDSPWAILAAQMRNVRSLKSRSRGSRYEPYEIEELPLILEASRQVDSSPKGKYSKGGYAEDHVLVALDTYTGLRSSTVYGLRVKDIDFKARVITTRSKGGHEIIIPLHRRLAAILEEHLEARPYKAPEDPSGEPMLFRFGQYQFRYINGKGYEEDARAATSNRNRVRYILTSRVGPRLKELTGKEILLQGHRFRESVGTYAGVFGMDENQKRVLLGHEAKTITQEYDKRDVRRFVGDDWDLIDLGDPQWVEWALKVNFHLKYNRQSYGSDALATAVGSRSVDNGDVLEALEALKANAPEGKEAAWTSLIDGLKGLVE